jgi:hypothetical protein
VKYRITAVIDMAGDAPKIGGECRVFDGRSNSYGGAVESVTPLLTEEEAMEQIAEIWEQRSRYDPKVHQVERVGGIINQWRSSGTPVVEGE